MKFSFWRGVKVILADCTKSKGNIAVLSRKFIHFIANSSLPNRLKDVVANEASQLIIVNRFANILDGHLGAFHNRFSSFQ